MAETGQPYAFTGDDPLNATDPLGLSGGTHAQADYAKMVYQKCHGHPKRNGCRGINIGHDLASALSKHWRGAVEAAGCAAMPVVCGTAAVAKVTHHTLGICASGSVGFGAGASGSVCAGFTGNGSPFASATVGAGGSSPVGEVGVGPMISNAQTPEDLRGPFGYGGGSADLGPGVGVEGAAGTGTQNQSIWTGNGSLQLGATDLFPFPIPVGFNGGASYTWTTP